MTLSQQALEMKVMTFARHVSRVLIPSIDLRIPKQGVAIATPFIGLSNFTKSVS